MLAREATAFEKESPRLPAQLGQSRVQRSDVQCDHDSNDLSNDAGLDTELQ